MPMVTLDQRMIVAADIVAQEHPGGMMLVNVQTGNYWDLNQVGACVWRSVAEHGTARAGVEAVTRNYSVATDTAAKDVLAVLEHLLREGLLSPGPHP
jgi:hypothetical protein